MHEKLIHRSRRNLDASVAATRWISDLAHHLETQARDVGYDGRLSQECLDELQTFFTGLLEAQHEDFRNWASQRKFCHEWAKKLRQRRDEAAKVVYGQLVELRGLIRNLLGKKMEAKLFGSGRKTPREPRELWRIAHNVTELLRNPRAQSHICRGLANEALWTAAVEKMEAPLGDLFQALHELCDLESEERVAVDRLHETKDRLHQTQLRVFRLQECLLELAGQDDLAEELRPKEPSRRRAPKKRAADETAGRLPERARPAGGGNGAERPRDRPSGDFPGIGRVKGRVRRPGIARSAGVPGAVSRGSQRNGLPPGAKGPEVDPNGPTPGAPRSGNARNDGGSGVGGLKREGKEPSPPRSPSPGGRGGSPPPRSRPGFLRSRPGLARLGYTGTDSPFAKGERPHTSLQISPHRLGEELPPFGKGRTEEGFSNSPPTAG